MGVGVVRCSFDGSVRRRTCSRCACVATRHGGMRGRKEGEVEDKETDRRSAVSVRTKKSCPSKRTTRMGLCLSTSAKPATKKIIIAGAPASGKGTQCETIVEKVRGRETDADDARFWNGM